MRTGALVRARRSLISRWLIWLAAAGLWAGVLLYFAVVRRKLVALGAAVLWVAGVFYLESLDGLLAQELVETFATALLPPLLPLLILPLMVRFVADLVRP